MAFDRTTQTSKVQNTSGTAKHFGYLPPHGLELAANGTFECDGDIRERIQHSVDRNGKRDLDAFLDDVAAGTLSILALPGSQGGGPKWRTGDTNPVLIPVASATVIAIGDFIYLDGTAGKKASMQADSGSEVGNQENFAKKFIGIAMDASANGETTPIRVATSGVWELTTASASYTLGKTVGVDEAANGTELTNQTVAAVSSMDQAIGRVVKATTNATTVLVEIAPTVLADLRQPVDISITIAAGAANVTTATIAVKDCAGNAVGGVHVLEVWISRSAAGAGLTATSASGALAATSGEVLTAFTAKKHISAVTNVAGVLVLTLTDTAKTEGEIFCVKNPRTGILHTSAATVTASYGA